MTIYEAEIDSKHDLVQIESAVQGQEAKGYEFLKNEIRALPTGVQNIASFNKLAVGQLPSAKIALRGAADAPPPTKNQIWVGTMVVSGNTVTIKAYR